MSNKNAAYPETTYLFQAGDDFFGYGKKRLTYGPTGPKMPP